MCRHGFILIIQGDSAITLVTDSLDYYLQFCDLDAGTTRFCCIAIIDRPVRRVHFKEIN